MKLTPLKIDGAWIIELNKFEEGRGIFYKSSPKKDTTMDLTADRMITV